MPANGIQPSDNQNSGSPQGEPEFLAVGRLGRPHGVRGDLILHVWTDFPERLIPGAVLLAGDALDEVELTHVRPHKQNLIVHLDGVNHREAATRYTNLILHIPIEYAMPLEEGEFYHHQLVGLAVVSDEGQPLGQLTRVIETGANDVYVVSDADGGELLLPAIDEVVRKIDLPARQILVHVIPGLLD